MILGRLEPDVLERTKQEVRNIIEKYPNDKRYTNILQQSGFLGSIVYRKEIIEKCDEVLGKNWKTSSIQINKLPPDYNSWSWHVDYPYYIYEAWKEGEKLLSYQFIIAIDDFSAGAGSIAVSDKIYKRWENRKTFPDKYTVMEAPAGSIIGLDPRILHSSTPNPSSQNRCSLLISMVRENINPMESL